MKIDKYLPKSAQDKITEAIGEAEKQVNAEIVPVFMTASDDYDEAPLKGALLGAGLLSMAILIYDHMMGWYQLFLLENDWLFVSTITLGAAIGYLLARFVPGIKKLFIGKDKMKERAEAMTERVFTEFRIFDTSQHNGILIYVSLFEHQIDILPDKGFKDKIPHDEWEKVINEMKPSLKRREFDEAFIHSVKKITEILLQHGMKREGDAPNELPDNPRQNL